MQKFTIFTVLLTIVVVIVAAESFVNKYLPALSEDSPALTDSQDGYNLPSELDLSSVVSANVFGADSVVDGSSVVVGDSFATDSITISGSALGGGSAPGGSSAETLGGSGLGSGDFGSDGFDFLNFESTSSTTGATGLSDSGNFDLEDFSGSYSHSSSTASTIRNDHVVNSGFVGAYLSDEQYDGMIYKSISLGDLIGVDVKKHSITNGTTVYAKVYSIIVEDSSNVGNVYDVLKLRALDGISIEVNETNQFGNASFYMNDPRRDSVAFLTVRIGFKLYGFSYPKQYHPQIRNLVSNLMLGNLEN